MNYGNLKTEITDDPLSRGYSEMTDQEIAESLNTVDRPRNRTSMTGSEVLNAIDAGEWATRTAEQKQTIWDIVHIGTVNPFGVEATLLTGAFAGAGGATITALGLARVELISRAAEQGIGSRFAISDIAKARV